LSGHPSRDQPLVNPIRDGSGFAFDPVMIE